MSDILLTNDDGYKSIGFYPLYKELLKDFDVTAVAPITQRSWQGKSITSGKELTIEKTKVEGLNVYIIDGTPADCVQIGLYDILEKRPRLVVSGINVGTNIGHGRILSSETAGAGMEAVIDNIRAISSSLFLTPDLSKNIDYFHRKYYSLFENPAKITAKIIKILIDKKLESDVDLLSINMLPDATLNTDFEVTSLHREPYGKLFHKKGGKYIHLNPPVTFKNAKLGSDLFALHNHKISITPISLELTSKSSKEKLATIIKNEW